MAITYQFNKTSLQGLEKDLKMRQRTLPTLQSKETALRLEVKRAKHELEELDEEDKLAVYRARKIQKFLSQPFNVAGNFTGLKGKYVPIKDTIEGFKAIIEGDMDKYPEAAFLMAGTIDDVLMKAKQIEDNE